MADLLEQLAENDVPPPPQQMQQQAKQQVNRWLLVTQLFELMIRAMPLAAIHFTRAVLGALMYTATGRGESPRRDERE